MDQEIARDYAAKFHSIGNTTTILIFTLAFTVYFVLSQSMELIPFVQKYFDLLTIFAVVGNIGLLILVFRAWLRESQFLGFVGVDPKIIEWARAAFVMRFILISANYAMYQAVITVIYFNYSSGDAG